VAVRHRVWQRDPAINAGFVGLYQGVVAPNVADSDVTSLSFSLGGVQGSQTMVIAVKR
jgi:hypothetical protein